jgi:hypothetical protein
VTRAEFRDAVYTYCVMFGASETSGFRTHARNQALKGVAHSPHLVGFAVDVVYDAALSAQERAEWARRLGLLLVLESDHDHLQPLGWEAG